MTVTVQQVVDQARESLNDDDKIRYPDAECATYVNEGLRTMRLFAPYLFIGKFTTYTGADVALGGNIPLDDFWKPALVDFVIFRAQMKDEEYSEGGLAEASRRFWKEKIGVN